MLRHLLLAAGILLIGLCGPAAGQSTEDNSVFDFSLPGARSRAIGGAFVAIADDATSVYSNPAGLTGLFRPEVSIELRRWRMTSKVVNEGHAFGPARNIGVDTIDGIRDRSFESALAGVSFLSFAYPRDRWAVGVFSHQLANYERERQTNGAFYDCRGGFRGPNASPPFCEQSQLDGVDRLFPANQSFDLSIRGTGAAVAVDATPTLSVGASVQLFHFEFNAVNTVFAARGPLKYAAPDRRPENVELVGEQHGDDVAVGVNAGALWTFASGWTVGGTYRQGPEFRYGVRTTTGPATLGTPGVTFVDRSDARFKVPDTWAIGIGFKPTNYWRFGFEFDRIAYTQLFDRAENTATTAEDPEGRLAVERITIPDSNQLRFGGEYSRHVMDQRWLVSFRGGLWHDPNHLPSFRVDHPATGYPAPGWALLFPKRDGQVHVSGGVGLASQRHLTVDVAFDHAPSAGTLAASVIWRF